MKLNDCKLTEQFPYRLPNNWSWKHLSEISAINPGLPQMEGAFDEEMLVSFVPMRNVEEETGAIDISLKKRYREVKKGYTPFKNGDILFAKITPCMENGKIAIAQNLDHGFGFGSTEFHVIRPMNNVVSKEYLFFYVLQERFRKNAQKYFKGSAGQLRVPSDFLRTTLIPLPPINEQYLIVTRIKDIFSSIDAAIFDMKKILSLVKKYRRSILFHAFQGKLTEKWRLAHPHYPKPFQIYLEKRRQKNKSDKVNLQEISELPKLPDQWTWVTLQEIAHMGTGATPLRNNSTYYKNGTIPWVKSTSLNRSFITKGDEMITEYAVKKLRLKIFPPGTLLIAMLGDGKTRGKVSELLISAAINQACAALQFDSEFADVKSYIKYFFQTHYDNIRRLSSGGVQLNLNLGIIKSTMVPFPPLVEQEIIVKELNQIFSNIDRIEKMMLLCLERINTLRLCTYEFAFRGKLVISGINANTAPATAPSEDSSITFPR